MIIAIEASNLKGGGGITHISELLNNSNPMKLGIRKVVLFAPKNTLIHINNFEWLIKEFHPYLDKSLLFTIIWQKFLLPQLLKKHDVDLLLCPAGTYLGRFKPYIAMSFNMLIFDNLEAARYGISFLRIRLFLLGIIQKKSFQRASGCIFTSQNNKDKALEHIGKINNPIQVILPGIDERFRDIVREQKFIEEYTIEKPFKILYVSTVTVYKHQIEIAKAVNSLIKDGFPIKLTLIGSAYKPYLKKLNKVIDNTNNSGIEYLGSISFKEIEKSYKQSDLFVFGSTCEAFGNVLVEGMASGLPVLSSNYPTMVEIIGPSGLYFNPNSIEDTKQKLNLILKDRELRQRLSLLSINRSKKYNWENTSSQTFSFSTQIIKNEIV